MKIHLASVILLISVVCAEAQDVVENHFPVITPESSVIRDSDEGIRVHSNLRILSLSADVSRRELAAFNTPAMIQAAYALPSTGGSGAIAIVDPYDYPNALYDFNQFSQRFGLPQEPSTEATASNSVFQVVYASGTKPASGGYLANSWNQEASLDTQWSHAIATNAKIYLVEANSDSPTDLFNAVKVASALPGVKEVSMSWGARESRSDIRTDYTFQTPGVVYVAASGDQSAFPQYPATSPDVIAVGGTTLNRNSAGTLISETGWTDTGCGLSAFEARPSFQNSIEKFVGSQRGTVDISFNANPNTGYIVTNTSVPGQSWFVVGGTSAAAPCIAGVINVASTSSGFAQSSQAELARFYVNLGNPGVFRDITLGYDGPFSCRVGWDFITGVGTPLGIAGK